MTTDSELIAIFKKRPNDDFWKSIKYIQTCLKAKSGLGEPLIVSYKAPLDEHNPLKHVKYSFKSNKE